MKVLLSFLLIGITITFLNTTNAQDDIEHFDNYKVYNVFVEDSEQLKAFIKLNKKYSTNLMQHGIENGMPFNLALESAQQVNFEKDLFEQNISFNLINENLQELLDRRYNPHERLFKKKAAMNWTDYQDLNTIYSWMYNTSRENSFIKMRLIGFSAELRPIYALIVSKKPNNKAIFMESNIHAIEWISSAVSTCFLNHMITTNSDLLEKYDFIFIPILNPDGFYYTHEKNRQWRKNRKYTGYRNSSGLCYGTDLNRNYNSNWGQSGYNLNDPCDHFYAGKKAESEPEIKAAVKFEKSFKKGHIRMHLALHSYGQLVLIPNKRKPNNTKEAFPDNFDQMMEISAAFAQAAKARYGVNYLYGTSDELLGPVSGASKDYWYEQGIPYSATIELRDRGRYGFFLPPQFIQPNCEEFTDGLYAMTAAAQEKGLFN